MSEIRTEFGYERTVCDCANCSRFCSFFPGLLIPTDLEAISARLGYDDLVRFAIENLSASGGATAIINGSVTQIPTLTPQRTPEGACKFLRNNRCTIHEVAPFGCAFFDAHQDPKEADARSLRGHMEIKHEWDTGGLYARLWSLLYSMGLVAPTAVEARARMRRGTQST